MEIKKYFNRRENMAKKIVSLFLIICFFTTSILPQISFSVEEEKTTVAVVDFDVGEGVSKDVGVLTAKFIEEEILKSGLYRLTERSAMQTIMKEVGFQQTGCTDTACAVELGKMLNVEKMVVGVVSKIENNFYINARLIDVEKAEIEKTRIVRVKKIDELEKSIRELARGILGIEVAEVKEKEKVEIVKKPEVKEKKEIKKQEEVKKPKKKKNNTTYIIGVLLVGALAGLAGGGGGGGGSVSPPAEPIPPMPPDKR
jgi:hypothetical protein